jgi:hypothetical protein
MYHFEKGEKTMAIAPKIASKKYLGMTDEQLEFCYENLKNHFCFASKENQIFHIITHYMNGSASANWESSRIALEAEFEKRTGEKRTIEPKQFEITSEDVIGYVVVDKNLTPSECTALETGFHGLNVSEEEKKDFLFGLVQDNEIFNNFRNAVVNGEEFSSVYDLYKKIVDTYVAMNRFAC